MTAVLLRLLPRSVATAALLVCLTVFGTIDSASAQQSSGGSGSLLDLQPGTDSPTDAAVGELTVVEGAGSMTFSFAVRGLDAPAGTAYEADLHFGTCVAGNVGAAGPRYNDTGQQALRADSRHEVSLDFVVTAVGDGSAQTIAPFIVPAGKANSVVITDPDGVMVACLPVTIAAAVTTDEVQGITETAPTEAATLAFTGAHTEALASLGLGLIAVGVTSLAWRRRVGD